MVIYFILISTILLVGLGITLYLLHDLKKKQGSEENINVIMGWMRELKDDAVQSRESMQVNIHETNRQINDRLTEAARVIGSIQRELGSVTQIGPDIRRLSEVLASPKTRGAFGEEMLENMLSQVLPKESYAIQYRFSNGEVVDAMVRVGERILPIDSKFSMENFRLFKEAQTDESADILKRAFLKDVKKRVDEIYKKYILPQENTFDFALMYIPSEGVFSEVLDDPGIVTYSRDKRVFFVSPNTLYHHLQIILLSLRGQQINSAAQAVLQQISGIRQESEKFGRNLDVLGNHIKNAGNTMGVVTNDFTKLKSSIANAAALQMEETTAQEIQTKDLQQLLRTENNVSEE